MMLNIAVICSEPSLKTAAKHIADKLNLPFVTTLSDTFAIYLVLTPAHLQLQITGPNAPGPVFVDFVGGALAHRLKFGGGRRQLIGRAVGITSKKTLTVLDVTAGLGRDAWVLANLGCDVTMIERSPIVAALLQDGLKRAATIPQFSSIKLRLIAADAMAVLQSLTEDDYPDVIYLDPMFPPSKKTAAVKKAMRVLKQVVGDDDDSAAILHLACQIAKQRVVVKRHRHAPTIDNSKPNLVFTGKSSRFDVYLRHLRE